MATKRAVSKAKAKKSEGLALQGASKKSKAAPAKEKIAVPSEPAGIIVNIDGLGLPTKGRPFLVEYFPTFEQIDAELEARKEELAAQRRKVDRVFRKIRKEWRYRVQPGCRHGIESDESKVGPRRNKGPLLGSVNVGFRTKMGHIVSPLQWVIEVDVPRKYGKAELAKNGDFLFPKEYDGVPIKVREIRFCSSVGVISSAGGAGGFAFPRSTQMIGGLAIASSTSPNRWGTLGICVDNLLAVTNCHVVGTKSSGTWSVAKGTNIIHLPSAPGPATVIGKVSQPSSISSVIDGATIAKTTTGLPFVQGIKTLNGFSPTDYVFYSLKKLKGNARGEVIKVGAKTGPRSGKITNMLRSVPVPDLKSAGEFLDVFEITGNDGSFVTDHGDSGSVVVKVINGKPVVIGLNFAMSDDRKQSYAIPFGRVLDDLRITLPASRLYEKPLQ